VTPTVPPRLTVRYRWTRLGSPCPVRGCTAVRVIAEAVHAAPADPADPGQSQAMGLHPVEGVPGAPAGAWECMGDSGRRDAEDRVRGHEGWIPSGEVVADADAADAQPEHAPSGSPGAAGSVMAAEGCPGVGEPPQGPRGPQ
jgi:hypothetical protein